MSHSHNQGKCCAIPASFCTRTTAGRSRQPAGQPLNNICHEHRGTGAVPLVSEGSVTYTGLVGGKHRTIQQSQIIWQRLEALQMTKYSGMLLKGSNMSALSAFSHTHAHILQTVSSFLCETNVWVIFPRRFKTSFGSESFRIDARQGGCKSGAFSTKHLSLQQVQICHRTVLC